ncbi:hypothetical protein BDV39DRAFT_210781 [Aspergillus sergii]|uniref:Uncharacterized protein n=1 Tax=Aspergillus sergii TaxID=1034303 RepID=A0A5N6WL18_9EURO|nr:hypothetical protein BDV39DRAFT_210781 [Aspergillus sergii]
MVAQLARSYSCATPKPGKLDSFLPGRRLLDALGVGHMTAIHDLEYMLRQGQMFTVTSSEARAQQLIQEDRFASFLSSPRSDLLLVNGNFDYASAARISPLSFLCANLALSLSQNAHCLVLHYFCSLHDRPSDPLAGPQGLIRSILSQLLCTGWPFEQDFINTRSYRDDILSHSVEALCFTFRELVEQLPVDKRIHCIIDNITTLESERWDADLYTVIEMLYHISVDDSCRQIFKVLITAPPARTLIERKLPTHNRLMLQQAVSGGHQISDRLIYDDIHAGRSRGGYLDKTRQYADSEDEWSDDGYGG